jgi:hypothetical protein
MTRIVPGPRLLWLCGFVGVPLLTAIGLRSDWALPILPFVAAALLLIFIDLRRGMVTLRPLNIVLPQRNNLFLGRPAELDLRLKNP